MSFPHNIVRFATPEGEQVNVSAFLNGRMYVADQNHAQIGTILNELEYGFGRSESELAELFDATNAVAARFEAITDRLTMNGGVLFFDGDPVVQNLSDTIVRLLQEDEDFGPMVNFLENLMQNPNEHSRNMLFDWMVANGGFTITPDGCFIAYKGVRDDGTSINSGPAVVDGVQHNGHIPNEVGSVITMPRCDVQFDSHIGCSVGLHVGVWEYAHSFGRGLTLKVKVNPRDVVSVPVDCGAQKMRVCRYEVLERVDSPISTVVDRTAVDNDWESDVADEVEWFDSVTVQSDSDPYKHYTVDTGRDEWGDVVYACNCPAFLYSGNKLENRWCKHCEAVSIP